MATSVKDEQMDGRGRKRWVCFGGELVVCRQIGGMKMKLRIGKPAERRWGSQTRINYFTLHVNLTHFSTARLL